MLVETRTSETLIEKKKIEWPFLAKPLRMFALPGDKGLGDIVERIIGPAGGEAYKIWYKQTFGKSCGCSQRRDKLNLLYSL